MASHCSLCATSAKSFYHLFISCSFAYAVWDRIVFVFGVKLAGYDVPSFVGMALRLKFSPQIICLWLVTKFFFPLVCGLFGFRGIHWFLKVFTAMWGLLLIWSSKLCCYPLSFLLVSFLVFFFMRKKSLDFLKAKAFYQRMPRIIPVYWVFFFLG